MRASLRYSSVTLSRNFTSWSTMFPSMALMVSARMSEVSNEKLVFLRCSEMLRM